MKQKRQCGNCYFTRKIAGVPHCIKDPPSLNSNTGEAIWPTVKQQDLCGCFCDIYDDVCRGKPLRDPRIYNDQLGNYCKIPLTQGRFAKVDPEEYLRLSQYNWFCLVRRHTCYAWRHSKVPEKRMALFMSREIMKTPKHLVCDHINRNGLDNRKKNLRNCTMQENLLNSAPKRNARSKYKGLSWKKKTKKWSACIKRAGIYKHLGYFESEIEAAKAYDAAAKILHGEFAYLNFPEQ